MEKNIPINSRIHSKWKSKCGRYTVTIFQSCFDKMISLSNNYYPNEIGTSLIGWYSNDGFDAYIYDIAPISSDSQSFSNMFIRGIKDLKTFYKKLLKKFKGKIYYIGDWHSHPNGFPFPSSIDDSNQIAVSNDKKTNCPESMLLLIAGNFKSKIEIGVFVYSRLKGRIILFKDSY